MRVYEAWEECVAGFGYGGAEGEGRIAGAEGVYEGAPDGDVALFDDIVAVKDADVLYGEGHDGSLGGVDGLSYVEGVDGVC